MIDRAAKFAEQAHKGAHRKGTRIPYIVHPLETALIASMLTNDEEILAAALLHDTIEDTGVTYEDLKQEFQKAKAIAPTKELREEYGYRLYTIERALRK